MPWCWNLHKSALNKWVHKSLPRCHFFSPLWVRDMIMAGLCKWVWVHVGVSELVWGREKGHNNWQLCLLSPFLPWGDWAMLVSRGDFRGLFPNDSGVRENKMLSERPVLKLCSCVILNWKHKWKLDVVSVDEVFGKTERGHGQREYESATDEGGGRKPKTHWVTQSYLASHFWPVHHRMSVQPHHGWLRA